MFKPFSDNIIFFDTEFSTNDPEVGQILSFGAVDMQGRELYLELEHHGPTSDWVKKNIIATLTQPKVSPAEAVKQFKQFVGPTKPYLVTYINQFDFVYLCKLMKYAELPTDTIPVDFASVLFTLGINPHSMGNKPPELEKQLGIDQSKYHLHHALDDAKLLKEVYLKLLKGL